MYAISFLLYLGLNIALVHVNMVRLRFGSCKKIIQKSVPTKNFVF